MATIPFQNFAFTDPVAAQQAVQMGQILAQAQAEKDRNASAFARSVQQQQIARQNAAEQRALTQQEMAFRSSEAEKGRAGRMAELDKSIAAQSEYNKSRFGGDKSAEAYDSLAARISSEDPPTDSEFESLSVGIDEDRKKRLRDLLASQRRTLTALADEAKTLADSYNRLFDSVLVGEDKKFADYQKIFNADRRAKELLVKDPTRTFRFNPKYRGPRLDPVLPPAGVGAIPQGVTPIKNLLGGGGEMRTRMPIGPSVLGAGQGAPNVPLNIPSPNPYAFPVPNVVPEDFISTDVPPVYR